MAWVPASCRFGVERMRITRLLVLAAMVAAGICPASAQTASGAVSALPRPAADAGASYRLGAGDRLAVIVFAEDKISGPVTIDPEGGIAVPLAGWIPAEGRTVAELTEAIRATLAAGYLRQPSVAVQVLSLRPWYILGEVNKPGQYEYTKGLTVLDAIASAAGFTYRARKSMVFITHRGQASEQRIAVTPSLMVAPGDMIRVGERYF